jgi:hypothetical protein
MPRSDRTFTRAMRGQAPVNEKNFRSTMDVLTNNSLVSVAMDAYYRVVHGIDL